MSSTIVIVGFDEIRFPQKVEFGVTGGAEWFTTVVNTQSGFEQRNQNWENSRHRFSAEYLVTPNEAQAGFDEVKDFFMARRGMLRGFRFKDHTDFVATAEVCLQYNDLDAAVGDGVETEFQTARFYDDGVNPYRRVIKKPVIETGAQSDADDPDAQVFLDTGGGPVLQTRNPAGDYSFDTTSGKITFNVAPAVDDVITWTGRFDVPMRFDMDDMNVTLESFLNFEWPTIQFIEIRIGQV